MSTDNEGNWAENFVFLRVNGGETPVLSATPPKKFHLENCGLLCLFALFFFLVN